MPRPKAKSERPKRNITMFKWKIKGKEILFGYDNQDYKFRKLEYKRIWFRRVIRLQCGYGSYYVFWFWGATQEEYEKVKEELYQHLSEQSLINNL